MGIAPDTADWTWVLERACPQCHFDTRTVTGPQAAGLVGPVARAWVALLAEPGADLARRPRPERWSVLEYGCHVRDVFRIFDGRFRLMLDVDEPDFPNWDQDASAVDDRYREQDPAVVAGQLEGWALTLAERLEAVPAQSWSRPGRRSDGSVFTVETLARYLIHDPVHHLDDVGAALIGLGPAPGA